MLDRLEAVILFKVKLLVLEPGVGQHALVPVVLGQVEHGGVQCVKSGQGDELELVAHVTELVLEFSKLPLIQEFFPVERGRAVVGQDLARVLFVNALRKGPGFIDVRA